MVPEVQVMLTLVSPFSVLGDNESHIPGVSVLLADATYIANQYSVPACDHYTADPVSLEVVS